MGKLTLINDARIQPGTLKLNGSHRADGCDEVTIEQINGVYPWLAHLEIADNSGVKRQYDIILAAPWKAVYRHIGKGRSLRLTVTRRSE